MFRLKTSAKHFYALVDQYLAVSRSITDVKFLKGRSSQLKSVIQSLYMTGRNIFIYGYRGVGKTSLALTAANIFAKETGAKTFALSCDKSMNFDSIIIEILNKIHNNDRRITKTTRKIEGEASGGFLGTKIGAKGGFSDEITPIVTPRNINETAELLAAAIGEAEYVLVLDEFDQLIDSEVSYKFSSLVKKLADGKIKLKLIFCGIAEDIDELFDAHGSASRYFHTLRLELLNIGPLVEIIDAAAEVIGIPIDRTTKYRIAMLSCGSPYYVHLISEKLFLEIYNSDETYDGNAAPYFKDALNQAISSISPLLKSRYEKAVKKYNDVYEDLLWALADGHQLQRSTEEIYLSYLKVMNRRGKKPFIKAKFSARMNNLKKESHGQMLKGTRQGWYEFRENIYRGYARLRAEAEDVSLASDHPLAPALPTEHIVAEEVP